MKVLVLGAGGMAGHVITLRLQELGYNVTGLARRELSFCENVVCDVTNKEKLEVIIKQGNFDVIVNAIGLFTRSDNRVAEAVYLNSFLPHYLVDVTKETNTKILTISTDCIFDGKDNGNYEENSLPTALDYYGRTKHLGELNDDKNLTFRTSIIGPDVNESGVGLFNWFMKQNNPINGFTKAIWTGVTTITLANAIDAAIKQNLVGLYHLVNNEKINKYDLLQLLNKLRVNQVQINKASDFVVDKSLLNTRTDFDFEVPSYENMILDINTWISNYEEYYGVYNGKLK